MASPTVRARFARGFAGFREGVVRRRAVLVLALVSLAVALIVRLPAILWPVFNWDESTFLAVGRRILQLPYTSTLENKPPLAFVPYALPTLFGIDDLRFARLLAALVVAATGVLLGLIASRRLPVQLATAVVAVVMISVVPGGDAWMTELDVMFWGSLVAYLTSRILRGRPTSFFWFGLCIGAFPLLRTNWALVAVMFGIVGLVAAVRARRWVRFILGGMIPWLIVIGAYVVTGRAGSLVLGAIRIPSSINAGSHGDLSLPEGMARMAAVSAALLVAAVILRIRTAESKLPGILALIGLVLIVVPAFPEYADYDHHTLQIVPFLALGVGMLMDAVALRTVGRRSAWRILAAGVSVVAAVAVCSLSVSAAWRTQFVAARTVVGIEQARAKHAAESQLSAFVRGSRLPNRLGLALQDHFVFWNAGVDPVLPEAVHPSMLTNPQVLEVLYGSDIGDGGVIRKALDRSPGLVLRVPGPITASADAELLTALRSRYDRVAVIDDVEVWELRAG